MLNEKQLLSLKNKINEAEIESNKLKGSLETLTDDLKTKYNCSSVKKAKKKIEDLEDDLKKLKIQFKEASEEIEKQLNEKP